MKKAIVIGSGFAGLSAASFLARAGWEVTVLEKNAAPGGRARILKAEGFTFDMGPSWYWMPDVFERFFACFGKKVSDYYHLDRLDPSYRVYWQDGPMDLPASYEELKQLFESIESGSGARLDQFMRGAAYKYEVGINKLVHKPGRSWAEFLDWDVAKGVFKLDVLTNMKKHIRKYFRDPKLQQLMEFPVLFLGALPENTPALYSLMNYADMCLGTWYPQGGMYQVVDAMYQLAQEEGVKFRFNTPATGIQTGHGRATGVRYTDASGKEGSLEADVVVGAADYHFIETKLLAPEDRSYSESYWNKRVMAPSCLLYYVGLNKRLPGILHHSLFFDTDFGVHGKEIYRSREWPSDPLFYVCAPSVTDETVAPAGCENLFFLIPVATGLEGDTEELREKYFRQVLRRYEEQTGTSVEDAIIYKKSYSVSDFMTDYHSFKGNAYGLANTLSQTAVLKPSCRSSKIRNLFYAGQLTVPGPGVPPSLISGEVVAGEVARVFSH
ncbi:MAG: phytoene desaturase [Terrimonas ferruginea]|uniref:phytoene desaturase family protein n=1 Tax=Terrimonas ferruginea TaxID=249 RepID=UPI000AFD37F9|nr:phytoene desaturase family protein [Terrimonas ferruginea]MBN8783526.1 phytoene desaturase [Terrimonas ferruginea]